MLLVLRQVCLSRHHGVSAGVSVPLAEGEVGKRRAKRFWRGRDRQGCRGISKKPSTCTSGTGGPVLSVTFVRPCACMHDIDAVFFSPVVLTLFVYGLVTSNRALIQTRRYKQSVAERGKMKRAHTRYSLIVDSFSIQGEVGAPSRKTRTVSDQLPNQATDEYPDYLPWLAPTRTNANLFTLARATTHPAARTAQEQQGKLVFPNHPNHYYPRQAGIDDNTPTTDRSEFIYGTPASIPSCKPAGVIGRRR